MKESGGVRRLDKPRKKLKDVQRIINDRLLQRITVHQSAKGAVRGRTLMDNVRLHVGKPMVAKFDMKDFFPSISSGRVYEFFVQIGCSPDVARLLARLTTYMGRVPQGTPTSPMLAGLIAGYGKKGSYNARMGHLAKMHGLDFTTWLDDATMSGSPYVRRLKNVVARITKQSGFRMNMTKVEFMPKNKQQFVTGLVVNEKPNVPKEWRRELGAILHNCKVHGPVAMAGGRGRKLEKFKDSLRGKIAHVMRFNTTQGAKLLVEFNSIDWNM
ncbi:MAG: RNA-directed DNA polymerase [Ignavibacteriales bacterium]|nr:RNA-directed DNA polymerase [Ignavibacteriales bacterium]